ncbi:RNA polymerase sigma-70 factor [Ureibacillus xyleni]|uniref:RNA polymerase sigma-70 factor n=1 Tax=Ureibacillus xyleni TaxID=614648 RepID=A0A285TCF2_9BACL|nr:sigma-70 family RNA polymerase sigma factor [Ureibacillus xyleni]SOC19474.1 RNA polymerase sigma-70 factor [Ureibacillus xyleni]
MQINEQNYIQEIKKRNEAALVFIIDKYAGLLKSVILKHLAPYQLEVDECLDDTLLAIWLNIDAFDERKGSFKNWIAIIAKYKALDKRRSLNRYNEIHVSTIDLIEPNQEIETQTVVDDIDELLSHLSPDDQHLFKKYYVEKEKTNDLATELNLSPSAIHSRLSRGRNKLRALKTKWITRGQ